MFEHRQLYHIEIESDLIAARGIEKAKRWR